MKRYGAQDLRELAEVHSLQRINAYVVSAGAGLSDGFDLYIWNTVLASRFHGSLQAVEVGVRNACDRELSKFLGPSWYNDKSLLAIDPQMCQMIRNAKSHGARQLMPRLNFFFWTNLFDVGHPSWLWDKVLTYVFTSIAPKHPSLIQADLNKLRDLRNRVAHLEPLYRRNLLDDIDRIERVASWIHPTLEAWVKDYDAAMDAILLGHHSSSSPVAAKSKWPPRTF